MNVARGSVVDEPALLPRLPSAVLAVRDSMFSPTSLTFRALSLDNVVLQPHQASATVETRLAMGEMVLANLAAHFAGTPLPSAVV